MKKNILTLSIALTGSLCFAQTNFFSDTSAVFYVSPTYGFYTDGGTLALHSSPNIEFGLQWSVISLGLDVGKVHLGQRSGRDTTTYFQLRPNLNVFQQGKFTSTLTFGIGYVPNARQNILIESTTGVQYSPSAQWSYNLFFGTYYFSGLESSRNQSFIGLSAMYFFFSKKKRGLFNK